MNNQTTIDHILYGAAYYPEYMLTDRVEQDLDMMKEAGLSVIRVGESTWSHWEPKDGVFCYEWMIRVLDLAYEAGIKVILGVPTYSIPPWLYRAHPDIVVTKLSESRPRLNNPYFPTYPSHITPGAYGPRQNQDYTHPVFLEYAERITRRIVHQFCDHPAVIGYQIDNETIPNQIPTQYSVPLFVEHLKQKFQSPEELNREWRLEFWGQCVREWDEIPTREGILNPGYKLEWDRFQQTIITRYLGMLAACAREFARPDQFIIHDFIGGAQSSIDQWAISELLDYAAVNVYYPTQDQMSGREIWFAGDLARSLKGKNYIVTETNAQAIGWDSRTQFPQYPGQLRLAAYAHIAAGASMVEYWHWATAYNGQETYWRGILGHDLQPNRSYREVSQVGKELREIGAELAGQTCEAKVAILYSSDSSSAIRHMPFHDDVDYDTCLGKFYDALYEYNIAVDFVSTTAMDLPRYQLVLIPPLYSAADDVLETITSYVENGGCALMMFKSGFANEYSTAREQLAPGVLRKVVGCYYQEMSNLVEPVPLYPDPFGLKGENTASVWTEYLIPETAEVIARLDHPVLQYPVITRNKYGAGSLTYQASLLSDALQKALIADLLKTCGLWGYDQNLATDIRVRHRMDREGRRVHYYLNFSGRNTVFEYPYENGMSLLSQEEIARDELVNLPPWEVVIIREGQDQ